MNPLVDQPRADTILLRLSPDGQLGTEAVLARGGRRVEVLGLNQAVSQVVGRGRRLRCSRLAIVGDPPQDAIGYGIVPLAAVSARPSEVVLLDAASGLASSMKARRYVAQAIPSSAAQLAVSGLSVAGQRGLAVAVRKGGIPPFEVRNRTLRRVLYLRPVVGAPARIGGSVTHSHGVIRALRGLGVEIDALTNDASIARTAASEPTPPCEWRVVTVSRAAKALPASTALGVDLTLTAAARKAAAAADAIYQRHGRFSIAGALLARLARRPLFLEYNGSAFFDESSLWGSIADQLALCERAVLAAASRIIVVSEVDRDGLLARGVAPERIVVNPNGVDAERFDRGGGPELRARLGFEDDDFVIGFVSSFGPWHGAPVLAEAFSSFVRSHPRARLLMIGDGVERPETQTILTREGTSARATFVGKIDPWEVPSHLDACDVLASPHVPLPGGAPFFGSPTKLFEYMASARPIVASALGQIGEVLEHGRNAVLVTPGSARSFAGGLQGVLGSADWGQSLGREARQQALDEHGWTRNARRVVEAYGALAVPGSRRG